MPDQTSVAVLGFRPHTYWTAAVALAGQRNSPQVVHRRRIVFAFDKERFVYHRAAEAAPAEVFALIEEVRAATQANAAREIGDLVADLGRSGLRARIAVTPASTANPAETLTDILRSHSSIHSAEGNFYRDVVASACEAAGLEVRRARERELPGLLRALLPDEPSVEIRLRAMGAALGPPWSEDYKLATQAAWLHLEDHNQEEHSEYSVGARV